eukprot:5505228-Pleurochrysis_carterae.AAC.1
MTKSGTIPKRTKSGTIPKRTKSETISQMTKGECAYLNGHTSSTCARIERACVGRGFGFGSGFSERLRLWHTACDRFRLSRRRKRSRTPPTCFTRTQACTSARVANGTCTQHQSTAGTSAISPESGVASARERLRRRLTFVAAAVGRHLRRVNRTHCFVRIRYLEGGTHLRGHQVACWRVRAGGGRASVVGACRAD